MRRRLPTKQQLNGMTVKDMSDTQLVQAQTVLAGGPRSAKIAKEITVRGLAPAADDAPAGSRPGTMGELVDLALSRKDGNKTFLDIGPVPEALVQRLRDEAGIDAAGWSFVIDEAAVRHIFKQHGDAQTEAARGQVTITKGDLAHLADVVAHPDSIERAQEQKDGMGTVIFKKKIDDNYVYVQELRAGRKKLAAKTLWKARLVPPAAAVAGEVHTSETSKRDKPQGENTIAGKDEVVQPINAGRKGGAAAAPGQAVLRSDYGVEHIDGYAESMQFPFTARGGQNEGSVKGAFLHDAQRYLKDVARALQERGYTPASRNGKAMKPVQVNEPVRPCRVT